MRVVELLQTLYFAHSSAVQTVLRIGHIAKFNLSRPFLGPPNMSTKVLQDLRASFVAVLKDEEFLQEARKTGMEIDPVFGDEAEKLVNRLLQTPEVQAQKMRDLLKP